MNKKQESFLQMLGLGVLLFLTMCGCTDTTKSKPEPIVTYSGYIQSLTKEYNGRGEFKFFVIQANDGIVRKFQYKNSPLQVGDSIKYTSSNEHRHLGTIINYGGGVSKFNLMKTKVKSIKDLLTKEVENTPDTVFIQDTIYDDGY